ncbi:hypothetical protein PInf_009800 [Phytophthora infestans]|nr:hypothetical protein PInf_009800 [Phytophthora infestans]
MACKVTFAEYLPNVLVDTKDSAKRYWNASWEASRATLLRCYGVGEFVCWVALLCLSLLLFVPINLYDLVEFVLQGPIGVAIGLMLLVTYDYCYEWTRWDLLGPLIVAVTGVISHALRLSEDGIEGLHDSQAAEEEAPTTEAFLGNSYGTEQSTDLPIDLSDAPETMARLRHQRWPSVRRGRQTPSRGVCPVPGNVGVVPGAGGPAFVTRDLGEGQRAATASGWFPLTPQAPTYFAQETGEVMV